MGSSGESDADLSIIFDFQRFVNVFVQSDLCIPFCLKNCETVAVKGFLLANTRTFKNNPVFLTTTLFVW